LAEHRTLNPQVLGSSPRGRTTKGPKPGNPKGFGPSPFSRPFGWGSFKPDSGTTSCLLAPIGTYVDFVGAAAVAGCPLGTPTQAGSTSLDDCETPVLAVAYSNLNGNRRLRPHRRRVHRQARGHHRRRSRFDRGHGRHDQYPLDFDANPIGNFAATTHTVSVIEHTRVNQAGTSDAAGNKFRFRVGCLVEGYSEFVGGLERLRVRDFRFVSVPTQRKSTQSWMPQACRR